MRCRNANLKVGEKVRSSIEMAKLSAIKLGFVEKVETEEDAYTVQSSQTSNEQSHVHFNSTIY